MYTDKQVCVQLAASADDVALPAFAAVRRAAARLLLTAGCAAIDRYHGSSKPAAASCGARTGRTDRRTPGSCIDPAPYATGAVPIISIV